MSKLKEYICSFCDDVPVAKNYHVLAYNERQAKRIAKDKYKVDLITKVETSVFPVILESKPVKEDAHND